MDDTSISLMLVFKKVLWFTFNQSTFIYKDVSEIYGLYPVAGVTEAIGSNVYPEPNVAPPTPTAGVSSAIGDALAENPQSTYVTCEKSFGMLAIDYLGRTLEHVVLGEFTDEVTALGLGVDIGLGIAGLDIGLDIRDICAYIDKGMKGEMGFWEATGNVVLGIVFMLPIVGVFKYADEVWVGLKNFKWSGVVDFFSGLFKYGDEAASSSWSVMNKLDEWLEGAENWGRHGNEVAEEVLDHIDEGAEAMAENADEAAEAVVESGIKTTQRK